MVDSGRYNRVCISYIQVPESIASVLGKYKWVVSLRAVRVAPIPPCFRHPPRPLPSLRAPLQVGTSFFLGSLTILRCSGVSARFGALGGEGVRSRATLHLARSASCSFRSDVCCRLQDSISSTHCTLASAAPPTPNQRQRLLWQQRWRPSPPVVSKASRGSPRLSRSGPP